MRHCVITWDGNARTEILIRPSIPIEAPKRCPRVRRLSAVQSSAEACLRQQLLQPPAARMEVPRRPVSPLGLAPAKAAICQPSTTNKSAAVTTSTAHPIGGAKLVKAPMTSDTPAMTKASASRNNENLRGVEAVASVDRFFNSEGAEGSDILTVALRLAGSGADDRPPSATR